MLAGQRNPLHATGLGKALLSRAERGRAPRAAAVRAAARLHPEDHHHHERLDEEIARSGPGATPPRSRSWRSAGPAWPRRSAMAPARWSRRSRCPARCPRSTRSTAREPRPRGHRGRRLDQHRPRVRRPRSSHARRFVSTGRSRAGREAAAPLSDRTFGVLLTLPALVLLGAIVLYPLIGSLTTSLFQQSLVLPGRSFAGLDNFRSRPGRRVLAGAAAHPGLHRLLARSPVPHRVRARPRAQHRAPGRGLLRGRSCSPGSSPAWSSRSSGCGSSTRTTACSTASWSGSD